MNAPFGRTLHAEWTKWRTVRSWTVTAVVSALLMVAFSWLVSNGNHAGICEGSADGSESCHGEPPLPIGPDGGAVADNYYLVHQPLTGNGEVTVRVASLSGITSTEGNAVRVGTNPFTESKPGLAPWAKAGLIVTSSLNPGSAYAAVVATGAHGVRLQDDYVHDKAGLAGPVSSTSPRWLKLERSGDLVIASDSPDGAHWTQIGTVQLKHLPSTVDVGLMVASPISAGRGFSNSESTYATATFDHLSGVGISTLTGWVGTNVGNPVQYPVLAPGRYQQTPGGLRVSGSGDVAPAVQGAGSGGAPSTSGLLGAFAALIAVGILGALFISSEYRRGLIRTSFAATPARGRVLAAKAVVIGAATFIPGLIGAIASITLSRRVLSHNGNALFPLGTATEIRVVVGTALLVSATAILALAVATIARRSAAAVVAVVALVVLPLILGLTVSGGLGTWLLRLTPGAGFSVQQSLARYAQVSAPYNPANGYFPLSPWVGLAVTGLWALAALLGARYLLRRRDA